MAIATALEFKGTDGAALATEDANLICSECRKCFDGEFGHINLASAGSTPAPMVTSNGSAIG